MNGIYEGLSDREILVRLLEKGETLFVCINELKMDDRDFEKRLREIEITGSNLAKDNAHEIKKNSDQINQIQEFVASTRSSEETSQKIAASVATKWGIYTAVGSVGLTMVTIIIMWYTIIR